LQQNSKVQIEVKFISLPHLLPVRSDPNENAVKNREKHENNADEEQKEEEEARVV